jgi:hypothetical protein
LEKPLQRKRGNYCTCDIAEDLSDVLDLYQPTDSKSGNAKQFMTMTKAATNIKRGQASLAICEKKSNGTIEAQIGQYFWIPSLFHAYIIKDDPTGTYTYWMLTCEWNLDTEQFHRCYVSMSISQTFWDHGEIGLTICDETHTRGTEFKHIVLIAVTFNNGNNQLVILAFAI